MTDLRDQLADFDAAARRLLDQHGGQPIALPRTGLGDFLRSLRHGAGLSLEQVAQRACVTKQAMSNRERKGKALAATALVEHAQALGYRVVLEPDRRTA